MSTVFAAATLTMIMGAAAAAAALKPITGKLSKPGYTVIALGYSGGATSSSKQSFKLKAPADKVTLQLRGRRGKYAGPVVVGSRDKGKKVIEGVRAGAKLGKVDVLKGYARPRNQLADTFVDAKRTAKAKKGVPVGAGNFGFVPNRRGALLTTRATAASVLSEADTAGGADADSDGVPNTLDIDSNGNGILDNEESGQGGPGPGFFVFSQLDVRLDESLNANASGISDAQIDRLVQGSTTPPYQPLGVFLDMQVVPGDQVELDCGGLSWCSPGGTGLIKAPGGFDPSLHFPDCCDPDGDGFGTLTPTQGPAGPEMQLFPKATASQIGAGDLLVQRSTTGGQETQLPASLNFIFNTTPALISWQSSAGQSGTVTYPVHRGTPQDPGDPGTPENPLQVSPGSDGHIVVTMTFWKPQRRAIPGAGEGDGFIDIGNLVYQSRLVLGHGGQVLSNCPASSYATTDPNLTPNPDSQLNGFVDGSADARADPSHTLSYSFDVTNCLDASGTSWNSGEEIQLELDARTHAGDNAAQGTYFTRP